jgi:hypothetical protein
MFLQRYASRRFQYGACDCCTFLADWILATGRNRDPAEGYRGTYNDEASCLAVLRAAGGLLRLVRYLAADFCLARVEPATAPCGAIAVVRHQGRHFGAIRTPSGRWAIKCNDGLVMLRDVRVVAAWEV